MDNAYAEIWDNGESESGEPESFAPCCDGCGAEQTANCGWLLRYIPGTGSSFCPNCEYQYFEEE